MTNSLFNRIGGEAAVEAAVNRFFQKFLRHDEITVFFNDLSQKDQTKKIRSFFTHAMGGPNDYTSKDVRDAHAKLVKNGLNDDHFDLFLMLMQETLQELAIPKIYIEEFMELTESYRDHVLNRG